MYRCEIIVKKLTEECLKEARLSFFYGSAHIGGIRVKCFENVSDDVGICSYWIVKTKFSGVKLSHLWLKSGYNLNKLMPSFVAKMNELNLNPSFLYGVVSTSLDYAKRNIVQHLPRIDALIPKTPLETWDMPEQRKVDVEGWKLVRLYLKLGAKIVGPCSVDKDDHVAKLAFGIRLKDLKITRQEAQIA